MAKSGKTNIECGGGTGSDDCTATKAELLKGYTAVTNDSDNEPVEGALELTGTATISQVLSSITFYNTNAKSKLTGNMINNGAISQSLNAGESYTIPTGYHNGSGKVTANSLASQTSGTATAGQILSGQTAWVNGNKLTGTIASLAGQTITPSASQQTVSCSGKYMLGNIVVYAVNVFKEGSISGTASASTLQSYTLSDGTQLAFPYVLLQVPSLSQIRSFTATNSNATYYTSYDALSGICEMHKYLDPAYHYDIRAGVGSGNTLLIPVYAAGTFMVKYFGY